MREPLEPEALFPDRDSGENLAVQLTRRLRGAIESGALRAGMKLLGTRQLAKRLGLARNTVALAFEQLAAEGYVETRSGSGTFVAVSVHKPARHPTSPVRVRPGHAALTASLLEYFSIAKGSGPLRPGMPDVGHFPASSWMRCARKALRSYGSDLGYGPSAGLQALREAIAAHVRQFRGITALPEQIVVVEGAQAALHLIAFVLTRPSERVVVEDPCYALARAVFEAHDVRLHPVRVDAGGIGVNALPEKAKLAYVTPTHQFPLGGALPISRRNALLEWAATVGAYVVEDDYDSEFTAKTRPLPPLQTLDRHERVVYVGSFSKSLAPSLRLGYVIAPPHLTRAFLAARACTSLGAGAHVQATLAAFIGEGHFARHIRRMNVVYERRRAILVDALRGVVGPAFTLGPSQTGLHVALVGRRGFDDVSSSVAGEQRLPALSRLCIRRRDCRGLVLGFTNGSDEQVARAAHELVDTLRTAV